MFRENAVKGENSLDGDYFLAEVRGDFVNNVEQYKYNMIIISDEYKMIRELF